MTKKLTPGISPNKAAYDKMVEHFVRIERWSYIESPQHLKRSRLYYWRERTRHKVALVLHRWVSKLDDVCERDY